MLTKNAIGNMRNKYIAVLKKCHLLNTFGSAAMVAMLTLGTCGGLVVESACGLVQDACAADSVNKDIKSGDTYELNQNEYGNINVTGDLTIKATSSGYSYTVNNTSEVSGSLTLSSDNAFPLNVASALTVDGATTIATNSSLIIESGGTYNASGTTTIASGGSLSVESGGTYYAKNTTTIESSGSLSVSGGEYNASDATTVGSGGTLSVESGGIYNASGTTTVKNGGTLSVESSGTYNASGATTIESSGSLSVDEGGIYNVGSKSSAWITEVFKETPTLDASDYAILAIYQAGMLSSSGSLSVGNATSSDANMNFGSNSLLVVNATDFTDTDYYALTADSISVEEGASLLVSHVRFDDSDEVTVNIASGSTSLTITSGAWGYDGGNSSGAANEIDTVSDNKLYFDNTFTSGTVTYNLSSTSYTLTLTKIDANTVLPLLDPNLAEHINKASTLPTYIDKASLISDTSKAAATIEGAAKISVGAGVLASLSAVNELGASAVANRSSLVATTSNASTIVQVPVFLAAADDSDASFTDATTPMIADAASESGMADGFALWLQPMYQSTSADGFKSGNFEYGYDTDIFGVSLGADYTMDKSIRLGLAIHMGSGDTESNNSDFSHTENEFDYFGAALYSAYVKDNFSISADMGYVSTTNDVTQKSTVGVLTTGEFDAGSFSIGARAQYKVATSFVDIIPYVGARMNYNHIESFNTKDANGTVFHNRSVDATTFGIPVGLNLAKTMDFDGLTLTPRAKLGVQFTMGDIDVEQRVSLPNTSGSSSMESEVFDPVTFVGGVGLDVNFDDVTLALEYNLGASENVMSHQVMATLSYRF